MLRRSEHYGGIGLDRTMPVIPLSWAAPLARAVLWNEPIMPTTIDRFFAVVQLCQNLSTMQNNMRANVQIIQAAKNGGTIATFAEAQTAVRALGTAFLQRLAMNQAVYDAYPSQVAAGALALGIAASDMGDLQTLLVTWATTLSTATVTNQTQLDNGVTAVLANVPAAMLPF